MDKVDLKAFMFCSTVFPFYHPGETSTVLNSVIFPFYVPHFLFLLFFYFRTVDEKNGVLKRKKDRQCPASFAYKWTEEEQNRDGAQGDSGEEPLFVNVYRCRA